MNKIARFVIWICKKFTKKEIEEIIEQLIFILADKDPFVKPRDDFKEKHPNYRNFYVDPNAPLKAESVESDEGTLDFNELIAQKEKETGKKFKEVRRRTDSTQVPESVKCPRCLAPYQYLYHNDGKKKTQIRCKVCLKLFQADEKRDRQGLKTKYLCPHCECSLYKWRHHNEYTAYKCGNDNCPAYLKALTNLNKKEKDLQKVKSSQFKLRYQYREYHFKPQQLVHSSPEKPKVDLAKIHNSSNILGLILAFYVSFAIPARKTALIIRQMFGVPMSYQTVLNYAEAAAFYCHFFNLKYKGDIDDENAADECYIKVSGKWAYTFFVMSQKSRKIISYHIASNREILPATVTISEAIRTAKPQQNLSIITDGNPSYTSALHFINQARKPLSPIQHHQVIGLQNLDSESELYRSFKQLSERLNRTYKYHIRYAHGFNTMNGALALTTLFVTHYNFLRPHQTLNYKPPVHLDCLNNVPLIQNQWLKILSLAFLN